MMNKNLEYLEIKICEEFSIKKHAVKEKVNLEFELYEICQIIYAKLGQRMDTWYVDPILRTFEKKVGQYLKKNKRHPSYFQEKTWRDKNIIIKKRCH